jgi:hypothetical protein
VGSAAFNALSGVRVLACAVLATFQVLEDVLGPGGVSFHMQEVASELQVREELHGV